MGTLFKVSFGPGPILVMTEFEWMCAPETASPTDKPRRAVGEPPPTLVRHGTGWMDQVIVGEAWVPPP